MTKTPYTLKEDINHVLTTGEGWTEEISEWVSNMVAESLTRQFRGRDQQRKRTLRASNLGTPCERALWYHVNSESDGEPLTASTLNKFIYGDITESYILGLCKAAGHDVAGLQDTVDVCGIRGSRDCVIDGMLFDVKSAASQSFTKFDKGTLRDNDLFGYISQLSTYLYGSQSDPLVKYKDKAGFLAFDKQHGHIAVDIYDLSEELEKKEQEVLRKQHIVNEMEPPERPKWENWVYNRKEKKYELLEKEEDWTDGAYGNRKLSPTCSYCKWKHECWDNLRGFIYSGKPRWLTKVVYEPKVPEIGGENF
jgi:hypothetical protein